MKKKIFILLLFVGVGILAYAQQPRFWNEIQAFKVKDSVTPPPKNAILLVGSSSFQKWKDVQDYFPGYPIINHGFGGSTLLDVIRYANDVIIPYHPKQVLIYCGDNDLASSDTVTAQTVFQRFQQLFQIIRSGLPNTSIAFVSIKPSPSREQLMPKMIEANRLIKNYLKTQPKTAFIDVFHPMLTPQGKPKEELFVEDRLHMNAKGYAIWKRVIKPYLLKS